MNRIGLNIVLFGSICLAGCNGSGEDFPTPSDQEKLPIVWQVQSQKAVESKALINDNSALQQACTPDSEGKSESIGIWGSYEVDAYTFLEFDAVPLTYAAKVGNTTNPSHMWNYPGGNKWWEPGAKYIFRACFPMKTMQELMSEINPKIIQGMVTTSTVQTDLMAASAYVEATGENMSKPVQLQMRHLFSAVKFSVKAKQGYSPGNDEKVNSCWLENKDDNGGRFSTSGYLVYSGIVDSESIVWTKSSSNSNKMYYWEHKNGISIPLSTVAASALYVNDSDETTPGDIYCNNENWVLIIPQKNDGSLHFGYTLSNAGSLEFKVPIPAITYEPGKLYNYVLEISGADAQITLTIADWNQLDSSYNIVL